MIEIRVTPPPARIDTTGEKGNLSSGMSHPFRPIPAWRLAAGIAAAIGMAIALRLVFRHSCPRPARPADTPPQAESALPMPPRPPEAAAPSAPSAPFPGALPAEPARALHPDGSPDRPPIAALLASADPLDHVRGLAQWADAGLPQAAPDVSPYPPEVVLAAVELCQDKSAPDAARALLDAWLAHVGGLQPAGEWAHTLLIEARLPHGGGRVALDLMQRVNDPQAIFINLYEFAVNPRLSPPVRTEALQRLRTRMEPEAYRDIVRECAQRARDDNDPWAAQAERLLEELPAPAPAAD
jgi:hypothetical protein